MDTREMVPEKAAEYPTRDGKPMAETDAHRDEMSEYAIDVLDDHFEDEAEVYVSGNNFVYYTEGVPTDCVSPDTYVVRGVPRRRRDTYKVWEEGGHIPCFVLEITSKKTRREDLGDKMAKYRDEIRVPEYFLFDLRADWIPERLRGYVLVDGVYQPIAPLPSGRLPSRQLGLEIGVEAGHLRFYHPGEASPIPTRRERAELERQRAENERERAEHERERADHAEEEIRRLHAELEKRGGGGPPSSSS